MAIAGGQAWGGSIFSVILGRTGQSKVSGILPLAEKTQSDHSASVFVTAPDGLTLHVRR
jgi:hypothetical protein